MPAWQAECLRRLEATADTRLACLVVDYSPVDSDGSGPRRSGGLSRRLLDDHCQSMTPVDTAEELRDIEQFGCSIRTRDGRRRLDDVDDAVVADAGIDALLAFAVDRAADSVLTAPPLGVWTFSHDGAGSPPPGFDELLAGDPVTTAELWRLAPDGEAVRLRRGHFATVEHSLRVTADQVRFGTARWPAQVVTDVQNGHGEYVDGGPVSVEWGGDRTPTAGRVALAFGKQTKALADIALQGAANWTVGVIDAPIAEVAADPDGVEVEWLQLSERNRIVADPFVAPVGGNPYLFFEDLRYDDGKGTISYLPLDGDYRPDRIRSAFETPYHLSYPYPVVHEGTTYVVPEMAESSDITMYELHAPEKWERVATLVAGNRGIDPTIVEYGDRWWLFCTRLDDLPQTNLYVYHAPHPTGEWVPHANNPVKTDVRSARPAGTPWVDDGTLYRPSQYCAGGYGKKVVVNRIQTLTPTAFAERRVGELTPDPEGPYPDGLHTLSGYGDVTVIDGNRSVLDTYHARRRLQRAGRAALGRLPLAERSQVTARRTALRRRCHTVIGCGEMRSARR